MRSLNYLHYVFIFSLTVIKAKAVINRVAVMVNNYPSFPGNGERRVVVN